MNHGVTKMECLDTVYKVDKYTDSGLSHWPTFPGSHLGSSINYFDGFLNPSHFVDKFTK